jgi:hypothetical protein
MSIAILENFAVLGISQIFNSLRACSDLYAHTERTGQELMRTLPIRNSSIYAYAHQFPHFFTACQELMRALTMCQVLRRAHSAVPSKHAEHTHQELMRTLSIRVRN